MKRFSLFKLLVTVILVICVSMSGFQGNAFAASANSPEKTVTVYGWSYTYYSGVHNDSKGTWARGVVNMQSYLPVGYVGINAKLYDNTGRLMTSSNWVYNNTSGNIGTMAVDTIKIVSSGSGTYYAKSEMQFYNGNGYNSYTSNATPYLQRSLVNIIPNKSYEVNENNLTYGSNFYAKSIEDSPDLILAVGKNGVEGYVYSKDINLELNTLGEVLAYINAGQPNNTVPVYAKDGITIIDTFELIAE
ncbi:hypothetical protein [Lysinibacillus sp. FSL M8-0134]|uniref:hypothetical protein n=1 Tax=Lysinibacillus sp. FSL M8-0134 TaxID=2921717 RepID=UPI00311A42EA